MIPAQRITDPKGFGHVALLLGGTAAEREISLNSGMAVEQALVANGIQYTAVDVGSKDWIETLINGGFNRAFNIVHGRGGEDGQLQGLLELIGMPYTGSGVQASALSMDKIMTKRVWQTMDLPTPEYAIFRAGESSKADFNAFPAMVKPANEGSSIGMRKVNNANELEEAIADAAQYDRDILVERFIEGREFTAAILQDECLPLIELRTPNEFYDFKAKYQSTTTDYVCPCGLPEAEEKALQTIMQRAFVGVGATGWGRVDFMLDADGQPWLLEVNTVPGMTDHSLVPMAAKQAGVDFNGVVWRLLEATMADCDAKGKVKA